LYVLPPTTLMACVMPDGVLGDAAKPHSPTACVPLGMTSAMPSPAYNALVSSSAPL